MFYLVVWWRTACTLVFLSILFSERRKRQNRRRGRGRATKGNFFFQVQMEACEASGEGRFPDIGCWMWSNEVKMGKIDDGLYNDSMIKCWNKEPVDYRKLDAHFHHFKGSSSS
ncbi:uncharacterized protein LOC131041634 isoform X2 [Cryptomeria japonica]|uniref:uncharacterized protein LOC131041634 isoform X2 n=1 Tax=Cryptomeria japonica TaxID=3369 RepID=UPI0027DA6AFC|nr:uncharacterized protein LOC131041634 isoform X2 [Cryptomeria japonica]